jgi:predicted nucleic acid-binding Zn ribbon protein
MKKVKRKQALQFSRPCPPDLAKLIKLLNLVPGEMRLHHLDEFKDEFDLNSHEGLDAALLEATKGLPEEVSNHVWRFECVDEDGFDAENALEEAIQRYETLCNAQENLPRLVKLGAASYPTRWAELWLRPLQGVSLLTVDENGVSAFKLDDFGRAISNVEITRIRQCPVCSHIFWAGRSDQKCCNTKCSNLFRVHRHRYKNDDEKADYKYRRIRREEQKGKSSQALKVKRGES